MAAVGECHPVMGSCREVAWASLAVQVCVGLSGRPADAVAGRGHSLAGRVGAIQQRVDVRIGVALAGRATA
jgi:hypothetical protein